MPERIWSCFIPQGSTDGLRGKWLLESASESLGEDIHTQTGKYLAMYVTQPATAAKSLRDRRLVMRAVGGG
jgi:hypothetical protein